jgi:hypothetical protein
MRISSDQEFAGYPALEVRRFFRKQIYSKFVAAAAEHTLWIDATEAAELFSELSSLAFIRRVGDCDGDPLFELTASGHELARASAAKPLHRKTAERALAQFIERVHQVNSTPEYVYRINTAILFGSMLSATQCVGDVDVAVELQPKVSDEAAYQEWCMARRRIAEANGRSFGGVVPWAVWPKQEILLQLKARSRSVHLHEMDLKTLKKVPYTSYRLLLGDFEDLIASPSNNQIM